MEVFRIDKNKIKVAPPILSIVDYDGKPALSIKLAGTKLEFGVYINDIIPLVEPDVATVEESESSTYYFFEHE